MQILPRSLVDEAESEIWSINQVQFSFYWPLYLPKKFMYCGSDVSIVISARYGVCNSFFTKSFSGLSPFCLPHYDARIRVSLMTCFAQAKAHWRTREWKSLLFKISYILRGIYVWQQFTYEWLLICSDRIAHHSLLPTASIRLRVSVGDPHFQDPSSGNENDRPYVYLPAFLDTGLPRGNVNERDSGPMRGACHPYPTPQPVKVGHTTAVYNPYSLRIVMFPQDEIIESAVTQDLRFFVLIWER